ncbi:MAG TPA: hypothetical protein VFA15_00535 [Nitrososphaera sp.]|nr:hypothetical protein [Nitrososphaera sp.]
MLFGKKEPAMCAVCGRELKHRYKPKEEWKIEGYLCSDCQIEKTKEYAAKQQQQKEEPDHCAVCKMELGDVAVKPRWQWEMEPGTLLCQPCFGRKEAEYNKRLNFCATCGAKIGFIRYNPKPAWKIQGQMCRKCWDARNSQGK